MNLSQEPSDEPDLDSASAPEGPWPLLPEPLLLAQDHPLGSSRVRARIQNLGPGLQQERKTAIFSVGHLPPLSPSSSPPRAGFPFGSSPFRSIESLLLMTTVILQPLTLCQALEATPWPCPSSSSDLGTIRTVAVLSLAPFPSRAKADSRRLGAHLVSRDALQFTSNFRSHLSSLVEPGMFFLFWWVTGG